MTDKITPAISSTSNFYKKIGKKATGGGTGIPSTGKVSAGSGFDVQQGNDVYNLLNGLLAGFEGSDAAKSLASAGNDLLLRDTLAKNLGIADNLTQDQMVTGTRDISRSLLNRGVSDSGFATSQILASNNDIRSRLLNDAVLRSSQEEIQNKQTGLQLIQALVGNKLNFAGLLSNFTGGLIGSGLSGQADAYKTKVGFKSNLIDSITKGAGAAFGGAS